MNKLEIGMWVRTKNGTIFKIIGGNVDNWLLDISFSYLKTFEENWLECYNIIDLIEVGDYVNGLEVDKKYEDRIINTKDEIVVLLVVINLLKIELNKV